MKPGSAGLTPSQGTAVVRNSTGDGYVAINGATGGELWRKLPTKDHDPTAFAVVTGKRLVSVGEGVADALDGSTAAFVRGVDVECIPELACVAPTGKTSSATAPCSFDTRRGRAD